MLTKYARQYFNWIPTKIGKYFSYLPISSNIFTSLALLWAAIGAILFINNQLGMSLAFYFLASIWDAFDGAVARAKNDVTKFGYFYEGIVDRMMETILYVGLFFGGFQTAAFIALALSNIMSFIKPRTAMVTNIGEFDWPVIGEHTERLTILLIGLCLNMLLPELNILGLSFQSLTLCLYVISILASIGIVSRINFGGKIIEAKDTKSLGIKTRNVLPDQKS